MSFIGILPVLVFSQLNRINAVKLIYHSVL